MTHDEILDMVNESFPDIQFHSCHGMIAFTHEGVEIVNPLISSCGRFEVDPLIYGLTLSWAEAILFYNRGVAVMKGVPEEYSNSLNFSWED